METKESAPITADEGTKTTNTDITTVDTKPSTSSKGLELDSLSDEHLAELRASGISDEVIASCGAYTAYATEDLPEPLQWIGRFPDAAPFLVYELQEADKGTTWQVKPQPGTVVLADGRAPKYIGPSKDSGHPVPSLIERRAVHAGTRRVLLVEGTKQPLAVMSITDDDTAVYALPGITSWQGGDAGPSPAFQLVGGLPTYIIADADAAANRLVYDGAQGLGTLCRRWGATPVRFVNVPGGGKQGIDDVLGNIPADRRETMLELWIKQAGDKPCQKRPSMTQAPSQTASTPQAGSMKPSVNSDLEPSVFYDTVDKAVYDKYAGTRLFRTNDKLMALEKRDGRKSLDTVDLPYAIDLAAQTIQVEQHMAKKVVVRPLGMTEAAVIFNKNRVSKYPSIEGIAEAPILSESGNVVCESGYNAETRKFLDLSDDLEGFHVPDAPTADDALEALETLLEPFCDFPFASEADLTRAVSMPLTLLTRSVCSTAPLGLISANNQGTGKNLCLHVASIIATGRVAQFQKIPVSEEEMEKVLYSALLSGRTTLMFDEASGGLESEALASMITAEVYSGRILGKSEHKSVPNSACVFAIGKKVAARKDMSRRTIPIILHSDLVNPEARDDFKHPNLKEWVFQNRKRLLEAAHTMIRAWVVAGKPAPPSGYDVGSFEEWYLTVGGILAFAGRSDLMEGVREWRKESDDSELEDLAHIAWLDEVFDGKPFRAFDAQKAIEARNVGGQFVPLPSGLWTIDNATAQRLGRMYTRFQDRPFDGYVMRSAGMVNHTKRFQVVRVDPDDDDGDDSNGGNGGDGGSGGTPPPTPGPTPTPAETADGQAVPSAPADSTTVVFDLETGDAGVVQVTDDPGFVRLAAYSINGAEPVTTTDIAGELIPLLETADTIVGHNVVQFDLAALRRLYGLDDKALIDAGKVHDTMVLSQLAAGGDRSLKYKLNAVAKRCGVDGKLLDDGKTALEALEERFGGFDKIPVDNAEYVAYALQDVRSTSAVYEKMLPAALEAVSAEYLQREHEKMHALSVVESHGVRVDMVKVKEALAEEAAVKSEIRTWLVDVVGIPNKGKEPWMTKEGKQAISDYLDSFGVAALLTDTDEISISAKAFSQLAEQHANVPEIVELAAKMEKLLRSSTPASTVMENLHGDRVYPSIRAEQVTGRLSTTKPAMAVFGKRNERLIHQREMILPDNAGEVLISVDLSQIDARCLAAGSGDPAYAALFAPGRDAHTEMAIRVFDDASRRPDAKKLAHAMNYGMGAQGFAAYADIPVMEAQKQLDRLRFEFPGLEHLKEHLRKHAEALGWVATGFGRRVAVSRGSAYTQAPAAYGQGTARDVFLEGVMNLPQEVLEMVRIFVHDEIVLSVPRDRADEITQTVMAAFNAVTLPGKDGVEVPVLSDFAGPAESWAGCKD
ncbi:DNA-directed DNA polymerase [Corynebacterium sp. CMW7794]|uniref:DNA polymerase n=1 Tax=Corynebacterium TaxID=1716 RepID=UPI0007916421|nr:MULTISPECIES: DNA polymerase [Corynebacterium]KXI16686.1 DNA-directed DNA polymerase [Corynebacterium sp. CMW7794]